MHPTWPPRNLKKRIESILNWLLETIAEPFKNLKKRIER